MEFACVWGVAQAWDCIHGDMYGILKKYVLTFEFEPCQHDEAFE